MSSWRPIGESVGSALRLDAAGPEEFLSLLSRHRPFGDAGPDSPRWLFRGQSNIDWHLVPTAWRANDDLVARIKALDGLDQLAVEKYLINEFVSRANDIGFRLPGELRDPADPGRPIDATQQALAQHYGIPTSLLDWSEDPLVATYFASEVSDTSAERFGVWALDSAMDVTFGRHDLKPSPDGSRAASALFVTRVMKSENPNITAQRGIFTQLIADHDALVDSNTLGLDQWVAKNCPDSPVVLRLVTAKVEDAPSIREALVRDHITQATIYPSLDSVSAETMRVIRDRV